MIGAILNRLEELGKADDTLIVLYGDHEPYYMSNGDFRIWVNGNRIFTAQGNIQANDDVRFEYDGSGTAKLYVNDTLITTATGLNLSYDTSSSSNIYLGYYYYSNDYVYQGTINYIKITIL